MTAAAGKAFFKISLSCLRLFLCFILSREVLLRCPSSELGFFSPKINPDFHQGKLATLQEGQPNLENTFLLIFKTCQFSPALLIYTSVNSQVGDNG